MKRLVFLIQTPMGASVEPQESLDAVLAGSAFANCAVIFLGLGVTQLRRPERSDFRKDFNRGFRALSDFEIDDIFYCEAAARDHGLLDHELIVEARSLSPNAIRQQIIDAHAVMSF